MGLRNRSFTDEQFITAIKNSYSIAETLRKLSLVAAGANYRMFRILCKKLNIDHSHFTGQGHLKGKTHSWNKNIPLEKILIRDSSYNSNRLRKRLIKEGYFEHKCYEPNCGISNWCDKPLTLHLDHINGTNTDNRIENLRLLCPNCHSQTSTYCGRNKKKKEPVRPRVYRSKKSDQICVDCDTKISKSKAKRCKSCAGKHIQPTKIQWPEVKKLLEMVKQSSYVGVGKKLGVSDNAVRQRIKRHS